MFANVLEAEDHRRLPDDVLYIKAHEFLEEAGGSHEEKVLFGVLLRKWRYLRDSDVGLTNDEVFQVQLKITVF